MKSSIALLFLSGGFTAILAGAEPNVTQQIPLIADFGRDYPVGSLNGVRGWVVEQGQAVIRESEGGKMLVIPPSEPHSQASVYFNLPSGETPLFIDLTIRMGAVDYGAEFLDANGSLTSLVKLDSSGKLLARNWENKDDSSWLDTSVRLPLDEGGKVRDWTRLTLRQDPVLKSWDLFVDGTLKAANLGMFADDREPRGYFTILGEAKNEVLLQRLGISEINPLFEDADRDGLPDSWQKILIKKGRDEDPDADGLINIEEYLLGTNPATADTDRDGLSDAEEIAAGRNPRLAEESHNNHLIASFWIAQELTDPDRTMSLFEARQQGLFTKTPGSELPLDRLEYSGFLSDNYISQVRGWIMPPASGNYTFWVAGDDIAEFWLSSDDSPFLKRQIAKAPSSTDYLDFDRHPKQRSKEVRLEAGKRYYFEVQHKEDFRHDHFAVAWEIPGKRRAVIGGTFLERWIPDARDLNNDGLPDEWQNSYFSRDEVALSTSEADPDGDHLNNREEYRAGADPRKKDTEGRPGLITRELWFGIPGRYLFDAERQGEFPRNPHWTEYLDSFEGPRNVGNNYLARVHGYVKIPRSGLYRFHIAADDQASLWLGTGANKFTRRKIASVPLHSGPRNWDRFPSQTSDSVALEAGQIIYIEALHKQGEGDDYLAVAWTQPGSSAPVIIDGKDLIAWKPQSDDTDENDLPDAWQAEKGLKGDDKDTNFKSRSAYGDADGDGVTNGAELLAGTDPANSRSFPSTGLQWQTWSNISGRDLTGLDAWPAFPANPSRTRVLTNLDYSAQGESYLARARGYVVPPISGDYVFSLAGSDNCQLWLSPDESSFGKRLVAEVALATAWRNRDLNSRQRSGSIRLEAGKKYYIEVLHKKGTGIDHCAVGWDMPELGQTVITQDFLRPWEPDPADADDDGLPDEWEAARSLDARDPSGPQGAFGDPDGDLINNFAEWQHGTDPLKADSGRRPGLALWEVWESIPGTLINRLTGHPRFPAQPDRRMLLDSTEIPADRGSWFGSRLRGYLVPPVSGKYRLMVSGDDQVQLFVSTGEGKFDRKLVAEAPFYTGERDFDRYPNQTVVLNLEAGKSYFFELLHKEEGGRNHAALAWIPPGSDTPEILSGARVAAFILDPSDLDDDELPDSWEAHHKLDFHDNGNVDQGQGPWGDPDGDGLTNIAEFKLGSDPVNSDSDADGMDDGFEQFVTGTNAIVKDEVKPVPASLVSGNKALVTRGRAEITDGGLLGLTPSGTVVLPFTLAADGVAYFRLIAGILPIAGTPPPTLDLKLDGMDIGAFTVRQFHSPPGVVSGKLPYLLKGNHVLEVAWAMPEREKSILVETLEIFQTPGGTPPAGEGQGAPSNAVTSLVTESLTSPFCLEGTASYQALVRLDRDSAVIALPDRGWYADIALPEDGSGLPVNVSFENGLKSEKAILSWKACNMFESGNLVVRAGDALRLTGYPTDSPSAPATLRIVVNGTQTAETTPDRPIAHLFSQPGTYHLSAKYDAGDGSAIITKEIEVKALKAEIPQPMMLYSGQSRTFSLPGLPDEAEVYPDSMLHFMEQEGTRPRTFTAGGNFKGNALLAFRLPQRGAVLRSAALSALTIKSDVETNYYIADTLQDGTRIIEMDVFMPTTPPGLRVRIDIIVAGVTFEDGSVVKWLSPEDFDEFGMAKLRFAVSPGLATSFCHQITLYDGETKLGSR